MITYTLDITSLDTASGVDGLQDVVVSAAWMLTAVDDNMPSNRVVVRGTNVFDPPNPATFIEYGQLGQAVVKDWIYASGGYLVVKDYAAGKISELQAAATKTLPLPWL